MERLQVISQRNIAVRVELGVARMIVATVKLPQGIPLQSIKSIIKPKQPIYA